MLTFPLIAEGAQIDPRGNLACNFCYENIGTQGVHELFFCELKASGSSSIVIRLFTLRSVISSLVLSSKTAKLCSL